MEGQSVIWTSEPDRADEPADWTLSVGVWWSYSACERRPDRVVIVGIT